MIHQLYRARAGHTTVEFALVSLLTAITLLFVVETGRMLLVYAAFANATREGTRYAMHEMSEIKHLVINYN